MIRWLKSRTINYAILLAVLSVIEARWSTFEDLVGPDLFPLLGIGVAAGVAALRVVTTKPL